LNLEITSLEITMTTHCKPIYFKNPSAIQTPNGDKNDAGTAPAYIGCFHKSLPHNEYGEIQTAADFKKLRDAGNNRATAAAEYEQVPKAEPAADRFVSPVAGLGLDRLLTPYCSLAMKPAPKVLSASTAAEMVELYWMGLLRDLSFSEFRNDARIEIAALDINTAYSQAVASNVVDDPGKLTLDDVPATITPENVFRCGLPGENLGPPVSQFFLRHIFYGAQCIDQRILPYKEGQDYLTDYGTWISAQNLAKDTSGRGYGSSRPNRLAYCRPILTMRDLATFVNQDALHQAYFNAALILSNEGYPSLLADTGPIHIGLPYPSARQAGFVTFGGPHLLTLVSEVAARAMKVVWHQKWQIHLRLRPEAYGGLVQMQLVGPPNKPVKAYGLNSIVLNSAALNEVKNKQQGNCFLPIAFPSGSPNHPSYGAGHATVAGACVTILKAWFDGAALIKDPVDLIPAESYFPIDYPAYRPNAMQGLPPLLGTNLTVEGELNKLACNVALGRSMGGVHWRSDNTRSLRLGEEIAIVMLARELQDLADKSHGHQFPSFQFNSFNGKKVVIKHTGVTVDNVPMYQEFLTIL
jgi:hypothetical protein